MGDLLNLHAFSTAEGLVALLTLATLEIVLGIDNIVFLAIITSKLHPSKQKAARRVGLLAAMAMRILLLLCISWIMALKDPLFTLPIFAKEFTGKELILLVGGLFLIAKATYEIHHKLEGEHEASSTPRGASFTAAIIQIMIIDIVFSLDSVITAVGMAKEVQIMIAAVVIAVFVMMIFAEPVSRFVENHPTIKMLALSFLLLIGVMLVVEGWGGHVEKGYIYFAMGFSLGVELLNIRLRKKTAHRSNQ